MFDFIHSTIPDAEAVSPALRKLKMESTKAEGQYSASIAEMVPRPAAPSHLSDAEAQVWEDAVSGMKADYFRRSDFDTLADMCRHVVSASDVTEWIGRALADEEMSIAEIDRLLKMRERETRAANALARSLRLTKQAQITAKGASGKVASGTQKPWENAE